MSLPSGGVAQTESGQATKDFKDALLHYQKLLKGPDDDGERRASNNKSVDDEGLLSNRNSLNSRATK
jgi:hypothetical protein